MDDRAIIINPVREKGEPSLPATGLFLINPAEAKEGLHLAQNRGGKSSFLFNSSLMTLSASDRDASFFIAGPAVGAPMAVLTLEKLVALGARKFIIYGWCGALNEQLRIGEILLPTWAYSDEGTSRHYPVDRRPESDAPTRLLLADKLSGKGLKIHSGPIWTTDAPYRESRQQVTQLAAKGALGVDMEFAALAAAAAFRQVELTAVLLVSDELWSGTWNPGFRSKSFKKTSREILHLLADFCTGLSNDY